MIRYSIGIENENRPLMLHFETPSDTPQHIVDYYRWKLAKLANDIFSTFPAECRYFKQGQQT